MRANQQLSEAIPENASQAPSQTVIGLEPNGSGSFEESLLHALQPMRLGDFTVRLAGDQAGLPGKIADAFNDVIAASQQMARQLEHVGNAVGREGKHASARNLAYRTAPGGKWRRLAIR